MFIAEKDDILIERIAHDLTEEESMSKDKGKDKGSIRKPKKDTTKKAA